MPSCDRGITYPPELLPAPDPDDEVEVIVVNDDGSETVVYRREGK